MKKVQENRGGGRRGKEKRREGRFVLKLEVAEKNRSVELEGN